MKNTSSTQELLDQFSFLGSDWFKSEQTKLARTGNHVREVASGRLAALFSEDEKATLMQASLLLLNVKRRVEAAKEAKIRQEKEAERQRKANIAAAAKLLDQHLPSEDGAIADRLRLVKWALLLHKDKFLSRYASGVYHDFHSVNQYRPNVEAFVEELRTCFDGALLAERRGASHGGNRGLPYDNAAAFFRDLAELVHASCCSAFKSQESGFPAAFQAWVTTRASAADALLPVEAALLDQMEVALFGMEAMRAAGNIANGDVNKAEH